MTVKKAPTKAQKMGVKRAEKKTTMRTKRPQNDAKATPEAKKKTPWAPPEFFSFLRRLGILF